MSQLSGLKILIAEDDSDLRSVLTSMFEDLGNTVRSLPDGEKAWEALKAEQFDLVLSDIQMPFLTGYELLKKMRTLDRTQPCFILMTGQTSISEAEIKKLGVAALLQKPFRMTLLKAVLTSVLAAGF